MESSAVMATEYHNPWLYLLHREQVKRLDVSQVQRLVLVSVTTSLSKFQKSFQLICLGGHVKNFPEGFKTGGDKIPTLPYWKMAKLVVQYYHDRCHKQLDDVVAMLRQDVWVVQARKITATIEQRCRICLERRKRCAGQLMGNLPKS